MHFFKLSKLFEEAIVNQRNSNTVTDARSDPDRGKYEIKKEFIFIFRLPMKMSVKLNIYYRHIIK